MALAFAHGSTVTGGTTDGLDSEEIRRARPYCFAAGALQLISPAASYAAGTTTCSGGSVAAGSYSSLTITGFCTADAGNVDVATNVTVAPGGELVAAFGGSDVHVGGNLTVQSNGVLILGCEPEALSVSTTPIKSTARSRRTTRSDGISRRRVRSR